MVYHRPNRRRVQTARTSGRISTMFYSIRPELIITLGHRPNGRSIRARDHPFVIASGQVWQVINVLVEMSFFASPAAAQRRLSSRLRRQHFNGKKSTKRSIRRYHGCDVTSMQKEPMWSLSTVLSVGSTKITYDHGKNFRRDWIVGSTNQRTSNLIDHATNEVHKASMSKLKVEQSRARGESAATSITIGRLLSSMDDETRERMAKKFDVCFMMAKESLPFTKHLESRHGVDLGPAYHTPDSAKTFTSYISKSQCQTFINTL